MVKKVKKKCLKSVQKEEKTKVKHIKHGKFK